MSIDPIRFADGVADVINSALKPLVARVKALENDRLAFRGTWCSSGVYRRGDLVVRDGSLWHCNDGSTPEKPGTGDRWQLAVKRGGAS